MKVNVMIIIKNIKIKIIIKNKFKTLARSRQDLFFYHLFF